LFYPPDIPYSSCRTVGKLTGPSVHVTNHGNPLSYSTSAPPYHQIVIRATFLSPAHGGAGFRHHSSSVQGYAPAPRHMSLDHGAGAAVPHPVSLRTRSRPQEPTLGSLGLSEYFVVRPARHREVERPQHVARVSGVSKWPGGGGLGLRCAVESAVATS